MANEVSFRLSTTRFDENYAPSSTSRTTTNFANLARGEQRQQNLRTALALIDRRFNELARAENPDGDRFAVELDIVSVELVLGDEADAAFPLIEVLDVQIVDRLTGLRHDGIVGNNFSSYIRDYDFSVLLPAVADGAGIPADFGDLHGKLFAHFLDSDAYRRSFDTAPVICISVSTSRTYRRLPGEHPVLGVEYAQDEPSLTDAYFAKMGLRARYFMPPGSVAPLAFYFRGDLLGDYSDLQLAGTVGTMETFQKIYRPEIYHAHATAGEVYRPTLERQDFTRLAIDYDRVERAQLAKTQGAYAREHLVDPYGDLLVRWAAEQPVPVA